MPFHKERYPKDWKDISARIKEIAGNRCQCSGECGLHQGQRCEERNGQPAKWAKGKIVLTVAHLNHADGPCRCEPLCGNEEHLRSMCQRCHLRLDTARHIIASRKTRKARKAHGELFA